MMIATANKAAGSEWTDRILTAGTTSSSAEITVTANNSAIVIEKATGTVEPKGGFHAGKMITSTSAVVIIANQDADRPTGGGALVGDMIAFTLVDVGAALIIT